MKTPSEEGNPNAPVAVVGEAPGKMEIKFGRPLIGPSGEVFNDCLRVAGLPRSQCYILNVWPFMVRKSTQDDIYDPNSTLLWHHIRGFTDEGREAASDCIDKLKACQANLVVTLGRPAFSLLANEVRPITKWRGSLLWSEEFEKKYLPTLHPAATLHGTYIWRYMIQNDLAKAQSEMGEAALHLPQRDLIVAPSFHEVLDFMEACEKARCFNTDIEVANRQVSCFSLASSPKAAMTVPLIDDKGKHYWTEHEETVIWDRYAHLMDNPNITKVNQNIVGFDAPFLLMQNSIRTRGPLGDPMIAHSIMYPHLPKGLDFIASYHTREPYWKDEGKIWSKKQVKSISWEQFQRYCAKDSAVSLEAWLVLSDEMTQGGYWPTYHMTIAMAGALTYMSVQGLAVDLTGIKEANLNLKVAIASKLAQLATLVGRELNPSSTKDCARYFYEELGIKPYIGLTGSVTTDDKAMARIVRRASVGSSEAKLIQEIRALTKLRGTYLEAELDQDGRLRCSWNPRGTWTGRLSSSKTIFGTGLDLQNIHPVYKKYIVSELKGGGDD